MANEYVDLDTLKDELGIQHDEDDTLVARALAAASRAIDRSTGRRFWIDQGATQRVYHPSGRVVDDERGSLLLVDDIGDTSGLVVETGSAGGPWTVLDEVETYPENALATDRPVTGFLLPYAGWWSGPTGRVRVTARWGWPAIPDEVVQATILQAARLYHRKDSPGGVLGFGDMGVVRLSRVDPDVDALIRHLAKPGIA